MLARGQAVPYTFHLVNPFPEPLSELAVEVMSPCCSSSAPVDPTVGAGSPFEVRVQYKAGYSTIRRGLAFLLVARRAGGERIQIPLTVIVDTLSSRELIAAGPETGKRSADGTLTWRFRFIQRRYALRFPTTMTAGAIDLRLLTDHGRQPVVTLTLVATGSPEEDTR